MLIYNEYCIWYGMQLINQLDIIFGCVWRGCIPSQWWPFNSEDYDLRVKISGSLFSDKLVIYAYIQYIYTVLNPCPNISCQHNYILVADTCLETLLQNQIRSSWVLRFWGSVIFRNFEGDGISKQLSLNLRFCHWRTKKEDVTNQCQPILEMLRALRFQRLEAR